MIMATATNPATVGLTKVTFIDTAVADEGIVHLPLVPHTNGAYVCPPGIGVARGPTLIAPGRVSISRHGVIGTNDDAPGELAADALNKPPAPIETATAAPMAAQRERDTDFNRPELNITCSPSDGPVDRARSATVPQSLTVPLPSSRGARER